MNNEERKHTPGPWFPINFAGFWELCDQPYYESKAVLNSDTVGEETAEANAKLAAAAPELLEACRQALGLTNYIEDAKWGSIKGIVKQVEAAILKATACES